MTWTDNLILSFVRECNKHLNMGIALNEFKVNNNIKQVTREDIRVIVDKCVYATEITQVGQLDLNDLTERLYKELNK